MHIVNRKNLTACENFVSGIQNDSSDIITLENDWAKALIERNRHFAEEHLAEGFVYTENEKIYSRDDIVQAVTGSDTIENAFNESMEVHLYGTTAIVTGWLNLIGRNSNGPFDRKFRFTDTWMKFGNSWKLIGAQDYLMP